MGDKSGERPTNADTVTVQGAAEAEDKAWLPNPSLSPARQLEAAVTNLSILAGLLRHARNEAATAAAAAARAEQALQHSGSRVSNPVVAEDTPEASGGVQNTVVMKVANEVACLL